MKTKNLFKTNTLLYQLRWVSLLWLAAGMGAVSYAQDDFCRLGNGGFSINGVAGNAPYIGCAPLAITLESSVVGADSILYTYNYQGKAQTPFTTSLGTTYDEPGRYIIVQVGKKGEEDVALCREVYVKGVEPPKASVVSCSGDGVVRLVFEDDSITRQYDQVRMQWSDGSPAENHYTVDKLELEHRYTGSGTYQIQYQGVYIENTGACPGGEVVSLDVEPGGGHADKRITINQVESRADGSVDLSFENVSGAESEVMVKTGSGSYQRTGVKSAQIGDGELNLPFLNPNLVNCLKFASVDDCGNSFESRNRLCTTTLTGRAETGQNTLAWIEYPFPQDSVRFELLRDGNIIKTFSDRYKLSYVDNDVLCGVAHRYQVVTVIWETARSVSAPVELAAITACPEAALFLPDAFSPNCDGINDRLKPNVTVFNNFQMIIYNRWGQPIFQTTSAAEGWDGTIDGIRALQGAYVYRVTILDKSEKEYVKSGSVRLLR